MLTASALVTDHPSVEINEVARFFRAMSPEK